MIRAAIALGTVAAAAAIVIGYLGALHPALDAFAHLRVQLIVLAGTLGLICLVSRPRLIGLLAVGVAIVAATDTRRWFEGAAASPANLTEATFRSHYVLLQQNLKFSNPAPAAFLRRVASVEPDIITLQEIDARNLATVERLASTYPHQHRCRGASAVGDVVILSRRPFASAHPRRCSPGFALVAVSLNGQAVSVGSLHLHWPWPYGQWQHIDSLEPHLPRIVPPGILAGDFNAVPWSAAVARLAALMDGAIVAGIGPTRIDPDLPHWLRRAWDIPIDNIVVTDFVDALETRTQALEGSDHDSVVLRFRLAMPPGRDSDETRGDVMVAR